MGQLNWSRNTSCVWNSITGYANRWPDHSPVMVIEIRWTGGAPFIGDDFTQTGLREAVQWAGGECNVSQPPVRIRQLGNHIFKVQALAQYK